jgi:hypothetical protein
LAGVSGTSCLIVIERTKTKRMGTDERISPISIDAAVLFYLVDLYAALLSSARSRFLPAKEIPF